MKVVILTILVGVFSAFGVDMHLPSLPFIVKTFHTTRHLGQVSISIYLLGLLMMPPFYGPLSDKVGRRPVILMGLTLAVIGSWICITGRTIHVFLLGRFIQGVGSDQ